MSDDSADKRAVGAHPESFSGRAHPRWTSWTQADPDPTCFRSCIVDTQHWRAVAHAAAKLSELQIRSSALSNEVLRRVLMDVANELRDKGALNEAECFIDATFVMAKGGGAQIGPTKRGKGMKIMAILAMRAQPAFASAHSSLRHWLATLDWLEELKPVIIVPSHGPTSDGTGFITGY